MHWMLKWEHPLSVRPQLGARPGGPVTVVVSDVREELVGYVNGQPYMRRELEMPSAALHHAGARPAPPCRAPAHGLPQPGDCMGPTGAAVAAAP
jgi:hypothetical protein